ncbi:hypothetical protein [Sulfurospirillum sp. 1612]|uniref:hypothetical protein n=1 Tax=Sulfurospirillum sp. 1612 TaxID=3094835 RepID=UPI002F93DE58
MKTSLNIFLVLLLLSPVLSFADISNSSRKDTSSSEAKKEMHQMSHQFQKSENITKSRGNEHSTSSSTTKTLSEIKSSTKTVSQTKTGSWDIKINPIPYVLIQLRKYNWPRKAFFLGNDDVGTSYYVNGDEDIVNNLAMNYYQKKAQQRARMEDKNIKKIKKIVELLNYTSQIVNSTIKTLTGFPGENTIDNIQIRVAMALKVAVQQTLPQKIYIYECNFGGNNDTYSCNNGEYTLQLTSSIPILFKNGSVLYSSDRVGYSTPLLTLAYATSTSNALSKLSQNSSTRSITNMVRRYTSHLKSIGKQQIAQKIENAFVEKSLTHNITNSASATVQAINSGSPLAVLKIFQ